MNTYKTIIVAFLTALLLICSGYPCLAITADNIAIIANKDSAESLELARYYCEKRGVPQEQIIALSMPMQERISEGSYFKLAEAIRKELDDKGLKDKVTCLLTLKGVPLRVNSHVPTGDQKVLKEQLDILLDESFSQLIDLTNSMKQLGSATANNLVDSTNFKMPQGHYQRIQKANKLIQEAIQSAIDTQQALDAGSNRPGVEKKKQEFVNLAARLTGLQGRAQAIAIQIKGAQDEDTKAKLQDQFDQYNALLLKIQAEVNTPKQEGDIAELVKERAQLFFRAGGLRLVCEQLLNMRIKIGDGDSESSFDSELSLVYWPEYTRSGQQKNWLVGHDFPTAIQFNEIGKDEKTMMVSRLDGPTLAICKGLVDKAIRAEQGVLDGWAYIDARGIRSNIEQVGSYGYYDESLRDTAAMLKRKTGLKVKLDDRNPLFGVRACPDTVLYCGWYSVKKYRDSFTFVDGAVGYHIASFEAETLREGSSQVWCKRLLEEGITATFGPVAEPYLHSFPPTELFFDDLVSGQYTLVECFYRCKPYNSWMMTLIGDPLYRPKYVMAGERSARPSQNVSQQRGAFSLPTIKALPDPIAKPQTESKTPKPSTSVKKQDEKKSEPQKVNGDVAKTTPKAVKQDEPKDTPEKRQDDNTEDKSVKNTDHKNESGGSTVPKQLKPSYQGRGFKPAF